MGERLQLELPLEADGGTGLDDLIWLLRSSVYPHASLDGVRLAIAYCRHSGLDPLQKPVHVVSLWDAECGTSRELVLPGIGLYRSAAARLGCAGISEPAFGPSVDERFGEQTAVTYPAWCRITVQRRLPSGEIASFTACEFWRENYARCLEPPCPEAPNPMWRRRPFGQLAKCTEAQALRRAFPEIGAQPVAEELEGKSLWQPAAPRARSRAALKADVPMPQARASVRAVEPVPPQFGRSAAAMGQAEAAIEQSAAIGGKRPDQAAPSPERDPASGPAPAALTQLAAGPLPGPLPGPILESLPQSQPQPLPGPVPESQPESQPESLPEPLPRPLPERGAVAGEPSAGAAGDVCNIAPSVIGHEAQATTTPLPAGVPMAPTSDRTAAAANEGSKACTGAPPSAPRAGEPDSAEGALAGPEPLATPGEQAYLARRLARAGQSLAEVAAGLALTPIPTSLASLPQRQFLQLLKVLS